MKINGAFVRVHARDRHKPVSASDLATLEAFRRELAEGRYRPSLQAKPALSSEAPQPGSSPMANQQTDQQKQDQQKQQSQQDPSQGGLGRQGGGGSPPGQQSGQMDRDQDDGTSRR